MTWFRCLPQQSHTSKCRYKHKHFSIFFGCAECSVCPFLLLVTLVGTYLSHICDVQIQLKSATSDQQQALSSALPVACQPPLKRFRFLACDMHIQTSATGVSTSTLERAARIPDRQQGLPAQCWSGVLDECCSC